jgi:hypothetical protein
MRNFSSEKMWLNARKRAWVCDVCGEQFDLDLLEDK